MGVYTYEDEHPSTLPPAKLYKALAHDADEIIPKVIDPIQSIENVEGNGGPGTVKKMTAVVDGKTSYVLHKVEVVDEANFGYDYSIVGGTGLDESLEKVTFKTKIVAGSGGGSIAKVTVAYHTKGDAVLSDEVREDTKAKGSGIFKAVEGYVAANPHLY